MPEETVKTIRIPSHWESPKYHLGQRVKQGEITGMEYHPPGTQRAYELGKGWTYWVLRNELCENVESFREKDISPLTYVELKDKIQAEIEFYTSKVTFLTQELAQGQQL
ncbi:hypothetical protein [Nostoc sp.]|uniref:hypothetical protein n=1 Tax=Nostoc sp. TaxID=1180 RepID=UPI002FF13AED